MSSILIESTPFEIRNFDTDFRHLYLVFVDDQGVESVITAGPDQNGPINFGDIEVSAGGLLENSDVARGNDTPGERGSREIDVGARDPADVWEIMLQQAENAHAAGIDYRPLGPNSNTVITSVLNSVDIDVRDTLPTGVQRSEVPGLSSNLDFATTLVGTPGNDTIVGGDENDDLLGRAGEDSLSGGQGPDRLEGNQDADDLFGGPAGDVLLGNLGPDELHGGDGDDTLFGGFGRDAMFGGPGDDDLTGGPGADQMRGGPGSDVFDYQSIDDAGDTILDFDTGPDGDRLLLTDLFDLAGGTGDVVVDLIDQAGGADVQVNPDGQGAVSLVTLANVPATSLDVLITDNSVEVAGAPTG
jgi:Ca2+-binding RTX toxin-like protein